MKRFLIVFICLAGVLAASSQSKISWQGEWIGTDSLQPGETMEKHSRCAARYFRKEFTTHSKVKKATAHVCGLGYFTMYINGQRVGKDVMAPPQTDFTKTVAYCSYDVTNLVADGHKGRTLQSNHNSQNSNLKSQTNNAIGVVVGAGYFFAPFQNYQTNVRVTYGLPRLCLLYTSPSPRDS